MATYFYSGSNLGNLLLSASSGFDVFDTGSLDITGTGSANIFNLTGIVSYTSTPTFLLGAGDDSFLGSGQDESVDGGNGNDFLYGGAGNDTVLGGVGLDVLSGDGGNDVLDGGSGLDLADYSFTTENLNVNLNITVSQLISTAQGADTLTNIEAVFSGTGNDQLVGSTGTNILIGAEGNDTLYGLAGNDTLIGAEGNDILSGGAGFDVVDYSFDLYDLVVNINFSGAQYISVSQGVDTFASIEGVNGGQGNDLLVGSSAGNVINGGLGDDQIYGIGGGDILRGGIGNDLIEGSGGNDTMEGGAGDADVLSYYNSAGSVTVDLRFQGTAQAVGGSSGTDFFTGFEDLYGSNTVGTDILVGEAGDNRILGFNGDDRLFGFGGNDDLIGMQGADSLSGGVGEDTLSGGGGADAFLFNDVTHSTSADRDTIADFGVGGADKIDLSVIDANTVLADNQAFNFVGSAAFGSAGDLRFATNGTNGFVLGDVDGDGGVDLNILLLGVTAMTAGDFIL